MAFFEGILGIESAEEFSRYIDCNMDDLYSFYNSDYSTIFASSDDIETVLLNKIQLISRLNFGNNNVRAFILISLDLCERLNLISAMPHVYRMISNHNIPLNSRMKAGICIVYPKPIDANDLISRFEPICDLLQCAIETEEDNQRKSLVTFLNYYSTVIDALHPSKSIIIQNKIQDCLQNQTYEFLQNIPHLSAIRVNSPNAYEQVQIIIDSINHIGTEQSIRPDKDFHIEENTEYSEIVNSIGRHITFDSIREVALRFADNNRPIGRGVNITVDEIELFRYLKCYGNMHKAKMLSALDKPFPQNFNSNVDIIDWGCGQGLATLIFLEKYGCANVRQITLIEPSVLAIKRAALHCKLKAPNTSIRTVCKKLNDIESDDIVSQSSITINLFSNILDIDDYKTEHLTKIADAIQTDNNYYVCASPYIDEIKTNKIERFYHHFEQNPSFNLITSKTNTNDNEYWLCNNTYRTGHINHGGSKYCHPHEANGYS